MQNLALKYAWLVNHLHQNQGISLEEIKKAWRRSTFFLDTRAELSTRTFRYWCANLRDSYGIHIVAKRTGKEYLYRLEYAESELPQWLLTTISTQASLAENIVIQDRIVLEDPAKTGFLDSILQAVRNNQSIRFTYTDYWGEKEEIWMDPFFVKMFRQRWHVVGPVHRQDRQQRMLNDDTDSIRSYGMDDRMTELRLDKERFVYPSEFSPINFYANNFLTLKFPESHMKTETVRLLVWENKNFYFRSVPLHHSQKEVYVSPCDGYSIFEYRLQPTIDFVQELRAHGDEIEVLAPKWLRREMTESARKVIKAYRGYNRATCKKPVPEKYLPKG